MHTLPPLAINGKFLAAPPTGVHRVAAELAKALADLAAAQPDMFDVEMWTPRNASEPQLAGLHLDNALPVRRMGPFTGIAWEQLAIPLRHRHRLLLNLCNIGPVLRGNCVTMIHDAQVHLTPDSYARPFRLWYKMVQPLMGHRHRAILTVSHYSRTQIARAGICDLDRIAVVHNGVDHIARVAPEPDIVNRLGLTQRGYVVATASTQAHKNVALLAEAFGAPRLANIRLVLIGEGSARDFAAKGVCLPPQTIFTGRVSDGALRSLYEGALCIAFPSRTEGFGLPPMEAMLLGCPAVVAPCGALPEVCGDAALYAGPDDPVEWARLIRSLADDAALRDRHVLLGRERAARFTWQAAARQLIAALSELGETMPRSAPGKSPRHIASRP